ncbi:hypothetical protein BCR36DRAFT_412923 [Piromyces finnis]|uniref:C2 domain-containing protein n=1 Tax=Piromyces finnis TaxID=1754191 RepID=A0A1Y1V833_9FUNG|nr:hypothetical protein BCR36DRAFT_412923 [Piromyces finnis]|eukprot:ORX48914.1 hypothetical protein BCR36DRAFT_412923 [Piromyces finnis]
MSIKSSQELLGTLEVTAVGGNDIKSKALVSKPNLYVVFEIGNKKKTTTEKPGKNPRWNEVFKFDIYENSILKASVYNSKNNEYIGSLELILRETIYIENQNVKMKIYNEKNQERGELNLLLHFQKRIDSHNSFKNTQSNLNYVRTEDESLHRKGSNDMTNTFINSNEAFAGQSKRTSINYYKNPNISVSLNKAIPSKIKTFNGRPIKVVQDSRRRSRSLSPMRYEKEMYGRNKSITPVIKPSPSNEHLNHFKSNESLNQNSMLEGYQMNIYSQPTFGYLESQSDNEEDIYSSSLPTNSAFLSSSASSGQFGNYLYNNTLSSSNSVKLVQSPVKTGVSVKYNANSPRINQASMKSDNASIYSSGSNHSIRSSHSKSPSLVIKTSINSMKMSINSASTPRSSTPHSSTPRTLTPMSSSSMPTPNRGTSYLPKPVQNNYRQSMLKSYIDSQNNMKVEMENTYQEPLKEPNEINSSPGEEERNRKNSSDSQIRTNRKVLPSGGKFGFERSNSGPGSLRGPREANNTPLKNIEYEEKLGSKRRNNLKVRSISNDSRIYNSFSSITMTNLEDSINTLNDHINKNNVDKEDSNAYSNKSNSYSTEVLVIDSSLENDQHDSLILGKYLSSNKQGKNSLRRSASFDSFIKEKELFYLNENDRRVSRMNDSVNSKEIFSRPAKSKDRFKESKESESENPPRYTSLIDSKLKNDRVANDSKEREGAGNCSDSSTSSFSKSLSLSRQASLNKSRYFMNISQSSDKNQLKNKNSNISSASEESSVNLSSKVNDLNNLSDECRTFMDTKEVCNETQETKIPKKYSPRRSSLSSKVLQQNILLKDMKPVKVISPSSTPLTTQAKISSVKEGKETVVGSVHYSETSYTNMNNSSQNASLIDAVNNSNEIDHLQKELDKISLSLKKKVISRNGSNSENSIAINSSSENELPGSAHSSPRMIGNNISGSATSSPNQSPKISSKTSVKSDTSMTTINGNSSLEENRSMEFSDDSSVNPSDKKDKMQWKDKYLRYIRKNSYQSKSKLDQCISEANSDSEGGDALFDSNLKSDNGEHSDHSYRKDNTINTYSESSTFEEVKVIDASSNSINMSNSIINMSKINPTIQFSQEEEEKEGPAVFVQSQEIYPQLSNISLSTINQDEDIGSDKEYDINVSKMPNDFSYEIMNSKDANNSVSYMNMNSQELLSRTNLSSISFNENSNGGELSPVIETNNVKNNRNSTERKKIMDNNFNILSQQIQKIRNEVVSNNSMEDIQRTRIIDDDKSDYSFVDPPRFDSNIDMNEALEEYSFNQSVENSTILNPISQSKVYSDNRIGSSGVLEEPPKRPPKNVKSRKNQSNKTKNITIKPILKNSTPSSANTTPTPKNLELNIEDLKKLHSQSNDLLTPTQHDACDQYSITSTMSSSSTPNLNFEEDGDTVVYPTNQLDEKKDEKEDTLTRTHKDSGKEDSIDEDILTPKLNQAPYKTSRNSAILQVPSGSAIQAEIYNISFEEESDEEEQEHPPRDQSLQYHHELLNPNGRMRSNSLSSIISSSHSIHNSWDDDESIISKNGDDEKAARRLTFGMDTNEQLFRIKRSNSLSSISTTSSYTYTLITKDSEKNNPNRNRFNQLINNSYAPQRIPPVRPMINISNQTVSSGLRQPNMFTNTNNYAPSIGSNSFNSLSQSQIPIDFNNGGGSSSGSSAYGSKIPNSNLHLTPFNNANPNFFRPSSPNTVMSMNENANLTQSGSSIYSSSQSTLSHSNSVKSQKSHKRFGHFKKGSISKLPMNTYHPLTHHGYKGDDSFLTEEAANFQIKNASLISSLEDNSKNKSKPSRIPFLNHKHNNHAVSFDNNGSTNVNVSKLEINPITNQL